MSDSNLAQLEMFSQIDELIRRLDEWTDSDSSWEPVNHCRALIRRVLERLQTLRLRLEAPLVVAAFGGTGTGKSTLVNALVGRDCVQSGRARPTTRQPVVVAHPATELETVGLPLEDCHVVRCDAAILRDIIIIDCPDPDTSESESPGTNLERLRQLLPHCDVLIYTSTQQKYRSARVGAELGQAATGCRLLFVQTHAELDDDIRADWRKQLEGHYRVPDMFFVDSVQALKEQQTDQPSGGDFARLQDVLSTRLAASERLHVRRANVIDLIHAVLERCRERLSDAWPAVEQLEKALEEQRNRLIATMSGRLRDELQVSRNLWERRLLTRATQAWGVSPFSSVLRLYNGLGNLIASASLFRARSSVQMALIGAWQGTRWLSERRKEQAAETQLQQLASLGLDDGLLRESQLVVSGYVREAHLDPALVEQHSLEALRRSAAQVEDQFLGDAGSRIDDLVGSLATRHVGFFTRAFYELSFLAYVGFVLYRVGRNFFYDSFFHDAPLFAVDFYVSAGLFFVLWSGLLVMAYTQRLRRGLKSEIEGLANELASSQFSGGLYPHLEQCCRTVRMQRERLDAIGATTDDLRRRTGAACELGAVTERG